MAVRNRSWPVPSGRAVEGALAVAVLLVAAGLFLGVPGPIAELIRLDVLFLPVTLVVPGLLAAAVLLTVGTTVYRRRGALLSLADRPDIDVGIAVRVAVDAVAVVVAAYTLWLSAASLYLIYLGGPGGVLFHPLIVTAVGGVLSALVGLRWGLRGVLA